MKRIKSDKRFKSKKTMLQINIVRAQDLPVADAMTSDPYVNIYLQGPIKTFIGKTQTIMKTLNPEWNETFNVPAIRGSKILFAIYDYDRVASNDLLAFTTFDPNFHSLDKLIKLPLTRAIKKKGENATITVSVKLTATPIPSTKVGSLSNPVYLSFEPNNRLWSKSPFSANPVLPYIFPFHLYFVAFNTTTNTYEICSGDHKIITGAWHSGSNVCLASTSLTESIRIDPLVLTKNGFKNFLICIGTTDYSLLSNYFQTGELLFWQSNEPSSSYIKGENFELLTPEKQLLKLAEKITFIPTNTCNLGVIIGGSIDNSGKLNLNLDSQCSIPSDDNIISGQTISECISILGPLSKIIKEKSGELSLTNKISFPLFTPISISKLSTTIFKDSLKLISMRILNVKEHYLFAIACKVSETKGEEIIAECNPKNTNPMIRNSQGCLIYSGNSLQIDFSNLPEEVKSIYIGITGDDVLKTDAPSNPIQKLNFLAQVGKNKNQSIAENGGLKGNEPTISISINSIEINKIPMKLSSRNNTFLWFGLIRDNIISDSWSAFNLSRGYIFESNYGSLALMTQYVTAINERMGI